MADVVEETSDVRIDDPVHLALGNAYIQGIQGLMLAPSGTEAVAKPEEVLLVDAFQHRPGRLLDDFVLQGGDSQRTHPAVRLRDVAPLGRLGPVGPAIDSTMQI